MATVKKSKKKIIIPIAIVLVLAIIVASVVIIRENNKNPEVSLYTISTDAISETVSATGDVTSGAVREYKVNATATVKDVFVKVGDEVKEGDLLATFDTSNLDSQVAKLQSTYNDSAKAYNTAVANQKKAKANLDSANKQIRDLEKKIAKLQSSATNTTTQKTTARTTRQTTTRPSTTRGELSSLTTTTTTRPSTTRPAYETPTEALEALAETLIQISDSITNIADSVEATNALTQVVMKAIAQEIESGNLSSDAIANAVGNAVYDAIEKGMIEFIDSGAAVEMIQAAVRNVDWVSIGKGFASDNNIQLTTAQLQLAALNAQKEIYGTAANENIVSTQKNIMDSSKSALDALKSAQSELTAGWKAAFDGTITVCDVKAGEQTSLLSKGIKLENMNILIVTISLGEYDVHKVKVGMPANIKTAYGNYTGEVATIAPTATGGNDSSLMDSVGSMAGISGLSSLTAAGAGVECTITVNEPDENIIIGFQASVDITIGGYESVPCVPIESIILEKEGAFVYLYNENDGTVSKTKIETGAISNTAYEIKGGVSVGDRIVSTPSGDYTEETFEVKVK